MLLTRENFRESVFERDNDKCVNCGAPGVDAHHILDRKLFGDGGYYLDNGATLCEPCHILAEQTLISCDELRRLANITSIILPEHFYLDQEYDKWGNMYLPNGQRMKGELFETKGAQNMLSVSGALNSFSTYVKYPRTFHLPWSEEIHNDDKTLTDLSCFEGEEVVITEKMDGENTTWYNDYTHARSINSTKSIARTHNKNEWAQKGWEIPDG